MKSIFTFFLIAVIINTAYGQYCGTSSATNCIPVGNPTQRGFYPATSQWPAIINGAVTSGVVGFKNWDTVNFQGNSVTVDSMQIVSVTNLPNGICWSTGFANNTWGHAQYGCVMLSGTACAAPGQYKMDILVNVYTNLGTAQQNLDDDSVFCFIRVVNPGEIIPAVDTLQRGTPNAFIAYGPTSPCASTSPWLSPSVSQTVCSNSTVILRPVVSGDSQLINNFFTYQWIATGNALSCTTCPNPQATITQNSQFVLVVTDIMGNVGLDTFTYTLNGNTNNMAVSFANNSLGCSNSVDTSLLSITGGTSPFSVNWGDGSATETGLGASTSFSYGHTGPYQVTITDAANCITSVYDTIKLNSAIGVSLNVTAQPTCAITNAGAITTQVTGGTPGYTYNWSTGANTTSVSSLTTGAYSVTITDALYCTVSASAYLAPVSTMYGYYAFLNETDANCGSNTGTAQAIVFGGTAPYTYLWSNSATSPNLTGLASGPYSVTVTDQGSCTATGSTYINASCYSVITGHVYADNLGTCLIDTTAPGMAGIYVLATSVSTQNLYYSITDTTGYYSIQVADVGAYTLSAINSNGFLCNTNACTDSTSATVTAGGNSSYNNLAMTAPSGGYDLSIFPTWTAGNPGFTKQYTIYYENISLTPYVGQASVVFVYDPGLIYQYSAGLQPVADVTNHTLTWAINGVQLTPNQALSPYFLVPDTMSTGYVLHGNINITPYSGDCDTANNYFAISDIVTGSLDPNEKDVSPANNLSPEDSVLTYTIHFQNTGTDSTHFIIVKDTLSPNLNPLTVHTIASSSRNYKFTVSGGGILAWAFNPYALPDSASNPGGSKGFVSFTVNKKAGLPYGTVISNTASVYFDYNKPVLTNTVTDTLALPTGITPVPTATNIVTVTAYPIPFNDETNIVVKGLDQKYDFELYDVTGRLIRSIPSVNTNQFVLHRNNMSSGVYMYRIMAGSGATTGFSQVAVGRLVVE